jgi:hypothetical protein
MIDKFLSRYLALFIGGSTGRGIRGLDVGGFLQLDFLSARATPIGEGHIFSFLFFFIPLYTLILVAFQPLFSFRPPGFFSIIII